MGFGLSVREKRGAVEREDADGWTPHDSEREREGRRAVWPKKSLGRLDWFGPCQKEEEEMGCCCLWAKKERSGGEGIKGTFPEFFRHLRNFDGFKYT